MSEQQKKQEETEAQHTQDTTQNRAEVKKDFKGLIESTKIFLHELLDVRPNTDQEATKKAIIDDIPFKGHTSWILICSIFIASVGLNANSTAVVIGAMLISPLMGPILGIGMSLAINDIDTLRRSLKNFAVMVVLSVLTAYLFFLLFPLKVESSELLMRTAFDLRDVLIAFFGGLALVIARAKKGTMASVIYGVAIGTALMPPLCTVGFGIAWGNWDYALGALYLFTINSIFIGLATFLVIKYLRFPMVRYANSARRRAIARFASLLGVLVMIPAGFTFWDALQESFYRRQAQQFVNEEIATYQFAEGGRFVENLTDIEYQRTSIFKTISNTLFGKEESKKPEAPSIELVFMGNERIPESVIATWNAQKNENKDFDRLRETKLQIIQGAQNERLDQSKYIEELYESQKANLLGKDERIRLLQSEVARLKKSVARDIPFADISKEAKANYNDLISLEYDNAVRTDFSKIDTMAIFEIKWKKGVGKNQILRDNKKIHDWLKVRLKDESILLREMVQ
ncbi:DUF389 domain-containing protein [Aggregatimonas sangjinii]|uniref:DUF389 domain-containing protein n=1 Tax=Aggregatimonas sangjinii TaxID=2583587 RepID=A0A5B7SPH3_9FLAO|nr:DUF389 domain-containing protein [Aggregatimonas sangjinii]QCW98927.1 DUF389 domain-containing protein [Aggregatimonas sangjinii]